MTNSRSFLVFGGMRENGSPEMAISAFGHGAYEHYMLYPYMRELMSVRKGDGYVCWSPNFASLHATILALGGRCQFEELGSTLFSTIDKFEKLRRMRKMLLAPGGVGIHYVGIEIGSLLIDVAEALHPHCNLRHFPKWQEIPPSTLPIVSRSYQSTSYAFRTTEELYEWVGRSRFGIHGIRFDLDGGEKVRDIAGNPHTFFDPDVFASLAKDAGDRLQVLKTDMNTQGDYRFAITWVLIDRLSATERARKGKWLQRMGEAEETSVCALSRAALAQWPVAHDNVPWVQFGEANEPFDLRNDRWQWR